MGQICVLSEESDEKIQKIKQENEDLRLKFLEQVDSNEKLTQKMREKSQYQQQTINDLKDKQKETTNALKRQKKENSDLKKRIDETQENLRVIEEENKNLKAKLAESPQPPLELPSASIKIDDEDEYFNEVSTTSKSEIITNTNTITEFITHTHSETLKEEESETKNESETNTDTECQWSELNPSQDFITLRNWLSSDISHNKLSVKNLKKNLAQFLTKRNITYRCKMVTEYQAKYGSNVIDDIRKIIKKGNVLELVEGLLMTHEQYDVVCVKDILSNRGNKNGAIEMAEILCCRTVGELQLIAQQFSAIYNGDIKEKIHGIHPKVKFKIILENLFDFTKSRNDSRLQSKIDAKLVGDLECLLGKTIDWQSFDGKKRLCKMIVGNSESYVCTLSEQYYEKSGKHLLDFVKQTFGEKSAAGYWVSVRVEYCLDVTDFYAKKLRNWKSSREVNRIFISTFDTHLSGIQQAFNNYQYGNGKTLWQWVGKQCTADRYRLFMQKMLDNCVKLNDE